MLKLDSASFSHNETIPERHAADTCNGANISPGLQFLNVPEGTQSFVVLIQDPDAPQTTFTHWVAYDIPADSDILPEGASNDGTSFLQGRNDYGHTRYDGPCPPAGETHRYFIYLYALDVPSLDLGPGASAHQVRDAIKGHVLEQAELIGLFGR